MEDSKRLMLILQFLNDEWDNVTPLLTKEQLAKLKDELEGLEGKLLVEPSDDEAKVIAKEFIPIFSNIKSLEFLSVMDVTKMRSISVAETQEDIGIVLLNSLKKIKGRYH
jgi:hypothetical protein